MRRLVVAALLLAGCSVQPAAAAQVEGPSVVHIGDSLSYGAQFDLRRAYEAAGFERVTIDAARGRMTVDQLYGVPSGMSALAANAPALNEADVVVIALGTNDSMLPLELLTLERVELLLSLVPDDARVVWVDAYRPGTNYRHWNVVLREAHEAQVVDVLVRWSAFSRLPLFVADGFHLNLPGCRLFAKVVARAAINANT